MHGFEHVLRVTATADKLAIGEGADREIVRAAALLHDAQEPGEALDNGRRDGAQRQNHHLDSASFAARLLREAGWAAEAVEAVEHCIRAHRFRDRGEPPQSLEARVLFDADKLDAIGAIGVARVIGYAVQHGQPFYAPVSQQFLERGVLEEGEPHSAYHELVFKLRRLKELLHTPSARRIAEERHEYMEKFFERLKKELSGEE